MKSMNIKGSMGNLALVLDLLRPDISEGAVVVDAGSWGTRITVFFYERAEGTHQVT